MKGEMKWKVLIKVELSVFVLEFKATYDYDNKTTRLMPGFFTKFIF